MAQSPEYQSCISFATSQIWKDDFLLEFGKISTSIPQIRYYGKEKWRCYSCLTLSDPMGYSPLGSSVHGILQARTLEEVATHFSRGSSTPRQGAWVSWLQAGSLLSEPPGEPNKRERFPLFQFHSTRTQEFLSQHQPQTRKGLLCAGCYVQVGSQERRTPDHSCSGGAPQAANPSVRQVQRSKKRQREEFVSKSGKLSNSFQDCRVARQAVIGRCMSTWIMKWGSA